jgi:lipoate-protein ligase A
MAVDEAILRSVGAGESPPTLRFYDWQPFCLSIGYGQRVRDVDQTRLATAGYDLVRRPTGGKAILHGDELTYSLTLPADHPIAAGGIIDSYRHISAALLTGLESLGAQPHADRKADDAPELGAVCFEVPSHYEITVGGRKLVGSAQMRRRGGVLQHGTLPLTGDVARICDVLNYLDAATREEAKSQVRSRAVTLHEALGAEALSWQTVADALARAVAETFQIEFKTTGLSSTEGKVADQLAADVYGNPDYTLRR